MSGSDNVYIGCDFGTSSPSSIVIATMDSQGNLVLTNAPICIDFNQHVAIPKPKSKHDRIQQGIELINRYELNF